MTNVIRQIAAAALLALAGTAQADITIGVSLPLTGPASGLGIPMNNQFKLWPQTIAGEKVNLIILDDASDPGKGVSNTSRFLTEDKVDLIMGPYATPNIVSAMGVAQRYGKMLIHHTMGIPSLAKYDMQFPAWSVGPNPETTVPNNLFDALAASPKPPKTIAVVTSKFPSVYLMSVGAREVAKKRGLQEVLFLEWEFGNKDYGPIANRVKDAKPDFVFVGAIGFVKFQQISAAIAAGKGAPACAWAPAMARPEP